MSITRREALIKTAQVLGLSLVGSRLLAASADARAGATSATVFTAEEIALLDEIGDTIIPPTPPDLPGAKAIGIGAFIVMMVNDCYPAPEQAMFKSGLAQLAANYEQQHREKFVGGDAVRRTEFLNALERTASERRKTRSADDPVPPPPQAYRMLKELTILGYYTSEPAQTRILGWVEVPGRFDGDVPYQKRAAQGA